jgi:hypothetical protein
LRRCKEEEAMRALVAATTIRVVACTAKLSAGKVLFAVMALALVGPARPDAFRALDTDAPIVDQAAFREAYEARKARLGSSEAAWGLQLAHFFWAAEQERAGHEVAADVSAAARRTYAQMVKNALRPELVPEDLEDRFVGLRRWRFGCDFLVARYAADGRRVQVIISGYGLAFLVVPGADARPMAADAAYAAKMAKELLLPLERFDPGRCKPMGWPLGRFCFGSLVGHPAPPRMPIPSEVRFVTDGHFVFLMVRPIAFEPWKGAGESAGGSGPGWPPRPKLLFDE